MYFLVLLSWRCLLCIEEAVPLWSIHGYIVLPECLGALICDVPLQGDCMRRPFWKELFHLEFWAVCDLGVALYLVLVSSF